MATTRTIATRSRVLVVDDSAVARKLICDGLDAKVGIEVVGTAPDPYVARNKIVRLKPDVVILDVELPRMDGITFLKRLQRFHPIPVIICSAFTQTGSARALDALAAGAVEVVEKAGSKADVPHMIDRLAARIRAIREHGVHVAPDTADVVNVTEPLGDNRRRHGLVAFGASTGGTQALHAIFSALPPNMPGCVIVQHLPRQFTGSFAERLNAGSAMTVREARDGDVLKEGLALLAPGDEHMVVDRCPSGYRVRLHQGEPEHHQRPAVDVLFRSVATAVGSAGLGILLTGMGADGAAGLLAMRRAGAATIAQNEASCVVFGMPRVAIQMDAAQQVMSLSEMPVRIRRWAEQATGRIGTQRVEASSFQRD